MFSRFELEKRVSSCLVTRELLEKLEEYLIDRVSGYLAMPRDEIAEKLLTSIKDDLGTETLSSVKGFRPSLFRDSTTDISIELRVYHPDRFIIVIRFNPDRDSAKVSISCESSDARERTVAVYDGITRILEPFITRGWIYHPISFLGYIIYLPIILLLLCGYLFTHRASAEVG